MKGSLRTSRTAALVIKDKGRLRKGQIVRWQSRYELAVTHSKACDKDMDHVWVEDMARRLVLNGSHGWAASGRNTVTKANVNHQLLRKTL